MLLTHLPCNKTMCTVLPADQERGHDMIFGDAFVGKACHIWSISKTPSLPIRLSYALQDLAKAKAGQLGLRSCRMVNALDMVQDEDEALTKECEKGLDWDTKLHFALLHVTTAQGFLSYGANPNAQGGPQQDTPLMLAAGQGNAAMAALLLAAGADPEVMRWAGRTIGYTLHLALHLRVDLRLLDCQHDV